MMVESRGRTATTGVGTKTGRSKTPPPSAGRPAPPRGRTTRSKTPPPGMRSSGGGKSPLRSSAGKSPLRSSGGKSPLRGSANSPMRSSGGTGGMFDLLGVGHFDNQAFETAVRRCIPAQFTLISSQDGRTQAQESYFAMEQFNLPCSKEMRRANAGSVATCALLQLMHENPARVVAERIKGQPLNLFQVSREIKKRVKVCTKLDAKPTISSSRPLGPPRLKGDPKYAPFYIVPPGFKGKRRGLLIGVIRGDQPDLKGPPNDIENIRNFLVRECSFHSPDITILMDRSPTHPSPTKKNILLAFAKLVRESKPGDISFIQFSGHGGRRGNHLFILPNDYDTKGEIMDEVILRDLIKKMPPKTYTTMLCDCCYSGTVGDLPYVLKHNSNNQDIEAYFDVDTHQEVTHKEAHGGQEYQAYKQARAERRIMGRLTDAVAAVGEAVGQSIAHAGEGVYNAAAVTASTTAEAITYTGNAAAQGVYTGATMVGNTAYSGAEMVGKTAYSGAEMMGTVAGSAFRGSANVATSGATAVGNVATSALRSSSNAANNMATGAASTLRSSGNAANQVATGAASTLRRTATGTADAVYTVGKTGMDTVGAGVAAASRVGGAATTTFRGSANAANALATGTASTLRRTATGTADAATTTFRGSANAANALATGAASTLRRTVTGTADAATTTLRGSANVANSVATGAAATLRAAVPMRSRSASSEEDDFEEAARKERAKRQARASRRTSNEKDKPPRGQSPKPSPTSATFAPFSAAANSLVTAASTAANSAATVANSAVTAASTAANTAANTATSAANSAADAASGLRRTATSPIRNVRALSPVRRPERSKTFNTSPTRSTTPTRAAKSPIRRTKTLDDVPTNRTMSKSPVRRANPMDAEERARKEAVERSRREAAAARAAAKKGQR